MFTEAKVHNTTGVFCCVLCGEAHQQGHACVELLDPDTTGVVGDLCPDCVEAGPEGSAERTLEHAHYLVYKAARLLSLAEAVKDIESGVWATLDDLHEAEDEAHRQFLAA